MSKVDRGHCLCGNVQFEAHGERMWVAHCHCHSCRRHTGSPVATFVGYLKDQVVYTNGERAFFASSPGVRRGFCADCGTPMTYESDRHPGEIHVYVSTFDEPDAFVPKLHVFYSERIAWMELEDGLPRFEGLTAGAEPVAWGSRHTPERQDAD